jgi:uncharacterized phage-associated protein
MQTETGHPSAVDVAQAVLERTGQIDTFKLQKLVYYCQAWHLVWAGEPLFDEPIEAWANGPVVPALYQRHRGAFSIAQVEGGNSGVLTRFQLATVDAVVGAYGHLSGRQLAHLTHKELPWRTARRGLAVGERGSQQIPLDMIAQFYGGVDTDPEAEPVEQISPEPVLD